MPRPNRALDLAETIDRVMAQAGELGYEPSRVAPTDEVSAQLRVVAEDGTALTVAIAPERG